MRLNKKDFWYLAAYLVFCILFFKDVIFHDSTFCYRDIVRYYQPVHFLASEGVWRGIVPFWNPYIFSGMPFLSTLQHALFYPLNLLHYLFPFTTGFKYLFVAHYFLAGLGLYLLLRSFSLSPVSSLAGAIIFTFNGYMVSILNLLTTLSAVTWLTFGLLFFIRAMQGGWLWSVLLSFTLALEFYSGQPEVMYFSLILLAGYSCYLLYFKLARPQKIVFVLLVSGSVALLLLQPLLLLLQEMFSLSVREKGVDYEIASYWSLHPLELITTFIRTFSWDFVGLQKWFRQSWLRSFYFGFLPLFFIALSYRQPDHKKLVKFFTLLGLAGLIIALGKYTPAYRLLFKFMPGFNMVRYPVKYIFILDLSMVVLASIGLERFLKAEERNHSTRYLAIFSALVLVGYALFYLFRNTVAGWLTAAYMQKVEPAKIVSLYQEYLPTILRDYFQGMVLLLLFGLLWLFRNKMKKPLFHLGLAVLLFGNVTFFQSVHDMEPLVKEEFYRDKSQVIQFLQQNLGQSRYVFEKEQRVDTWLTDLLGSKLPLLSNMGMNYHLADVGIYESLDLTKEENIIRVLTTQPNYSCSPLARMFGIRYIFSQRDDINDPNLFYLFKLKSFIVYENRLILPRAIIVHKAVVRPAESDIETANFLFSPEFDPAAMVVLTGTSLPPAEPTDSKSLVADQPKILRYEQNEVLLQVKSVQPSWLVLFDTNYPGWKATVNGRETTIYDADYLFRAIKVPAGDLLVRFSYAPVKFMIGVLIGTMMLLFLSVWSARKINLMFPSRRNDG